MAEVGEVIGVYRLEQRLGAGGMGTVFRAKHVLLGRQVAVKVLDDKLAGDEQYVSRFFQEAKIVNEIRHPNIIDVIDFIAVREPRVVAYVMELLDGRSLGDLLHAGALRPIQVINGAMQIASALLAVHHVNVVHRDLKPENIFVLGRTDRDWSSIPSLKILDFGIAKFEARDVEHQTQTGIMIGTPAYMAPEQIWGTKVSPATDIYAFGEILFEMLSAKRLFDGPMTEMMKRKASGGYHTELVLPENTPCRATLTELLRGCLAMDPAARPALQEIVRTLGSVGKQIPGAGMAAAFEETLSMPRGPALVPPPPPPQDAYAITREERPPDLDTPAPGPLSSKVERRASSTALALGIAAGALLAVGGLVLHFQHQRESAAPPVITAPLEPAPAASRASALTAAPVPALAAAPPAASPANAPFTTIPLESDPAGAQVFELQTNTALGRTPLEVTLSDPLSSRTVELRLDGHESRRVVIDASHDRLRVPLVPIAARVSRKPPVERRAPPPAKALRKDETTSW